MQHLSIHPLQPLTVDFYVYFYYSKAQLLFIFYEMSVEWKLVLLLELDKRQQQQMPEY